MQNNRRDDRLIQGQALQHGLGPSYTCSHTSDMKVKEEASVQPRGAPRLMEKTGCKEAISAQQETCMDGERKAVLSQPGSRRMRIHVPSEGLREDAA